MVPLRLWSEILNNLHHVDMNQIKLKREARKAYRIVLLKSDVNNKVTWHLSDRSEVLQFMPGHAEVFSGLLYLSKHLPELSHPSDPENCLESYRRRQ